MLLDRRSEQARLRRRCVSVGLGSRAQPAGFVLPVRLRSARMRFTRYTPCGSAFSSSVSCAATYHEARWARRSMSSRQRAAFWRRQGGTQCLQLLCCSSQRVDQLQTATQPRALSLTPSGTRTADATHVGRSASTSRHSSTAGACVTVPPSTALDEHAAAPQRAPREVSAHRGAHARGAAAQSAATSAKATNTSSQAQGNISTSPSAPDPQSMAAVALRRQFASDWHEAARRRNLEPLPGHRSTEPPCVLTDLLQAQTIEPVPSDDTEDYSPALEPQDEGACAAKAWKSQLDAFLSSGYLSMAFLAHRSSARLLCAEQVPCTCAAQLSDQPHGERTCHVQPACSTVHVQAGCSLWVSAAHAPICIVCVGFEAGEWTRGEEEVCALRRLLQSDYNELLTWSGCDTSLKAAWRKGHCVLAVGELQQRMSYIDNTTVSPAFGLHINKSDSYAAYGPLVNLAAAHSLAHVLQGATQPVCPACS